VVTSGRGGGPGASADSEMTAQPKANPAGVRVLKEASDAPQFSSDGAPINIWNDHSDAMSQRDAGWLQLYAGTSQEALDLHIQAFRIAEELSIPVMVCMDGFLLTHASERADIPEQAQVDAFLPRYEPRQVLDPGEPVSIGAMVGPEAFTEVRYLAGPHAEVTLHRAGHILGSGLGKPDGRRPPRAGDRRHQRGPGLPRASAATPARALHRSRRPAHRGYLRQQEAQRRGSTRGIRRRDHPDPAARGSVIIPAFAVDRTEVILRTLRELRESSDIPDAPVLVDSPMALAALSVYQRAIATRSAELRPEILADGPRALDPGQLAELRTVAESMKPTTRRSRR
jgi:Pyruvate flavodoxin/ferredoxin oxidoreductase, thiamine diP-bdg